jgi:uncharacterized protein (DUF2141 family)
VFAALAVLGPATSALAGDVTVRVSGIKDTVGQIRVAACTEPEFLRTCLHIASAPARPGSLDVRIEAVPPGRYAIQAFQDRDADGTLARNLLGIPTEPFGFSRSPAMRFGPPAFADAAVGVDASR